MVRRAVADPEFPRRGANPWVLGENLLFDKIFCQKLHENERNWVPGSPTPRIRQCRAAIFLTYDCIRALRRAKVKRIKEIWSTSKKIFVLDSTFVRCERTLRVETLSGEHFCWRFPFTANGHFSVPQNCTSQSHETARSRKAGGFVNSAVTVI